jgi:regulatory protein
MAGRRRGARTGRGWDAAPPRAGAARQAPRQRSRAQPEPRPVDRGDHEAGPGEREQLRDPAEVAREICLRQLAVRPRTRAELATALRQRGIPDDVAAAVLDRYDEVGMIDDAAFARAWVTTRHHGRGLARRALAHELRQRGVDAGAAGAALAGLDDSTEAATARALVDRKLRTVRGEPEQVFRRLVGVLARKGYPAGLAIRAVKEALAGQSADAAEFAEQIDPDALADAEDDVDRQRHPDT